MTEDTFRILGFAGSLRKGSYNRMLLNACCGLLPKGAEIKIFDLGSIPIFNADLESSMPPVVLDLKSKVRAADAILIITPEYNYSVPGVLKNVLDWASRPFGDNSFDKKPVAIMSASTGMFGGSRAQYHLRQMLVFLNAYPLSRPEVFVPFAPQKFSADGKLTDLYTQVHVQKLLDALVSWSRLIKQGTDSKLI